MKLSEIKRELFAVLSDIDNPSMEAQEEVSQAIDYIQGLSVDMVHKLDALAYVLESYRALRQMTKERVEKLKQRNQSLDNSIQSLNDFILQNVRELQGKISSDSYEFKVKKTPPKAIIEDERLLPIEYCRIKETTSPNKIEILKQLKSGKQIPGCKLVQGDRVEF